MLILHLDSILVSYLLNISNFSLRETMFEDVLDHLYDSELLLGVYTSLVILQMNIL